MKFLPLLFAASLQAAPIYTSVNPTPHSGEVDLSVIVQPYEAMGFERIPDNIDLLFPVAGYESTFLLAWEDQVPGLSDNDFNDLVLFVDFSTFEWVVVAKHSASAHSAGQTNGVPWIESDGCCNTGAWTAQSPVDRLVTWGKPLTPPSAVPEPGTVALMGAGLLAVGWWRRKR